MKSLKKVEQSGKLEIDILRILSVSESERVLSIRCVFADLVPGFVGVRVEGGGGCFNDVVITQSYLNPT